MEAMAKVLALALPIAQETRFADIRDLARLAYQPR